jgi:hypothetical protein
MAYQNAFDASACTVTVKQDAATLFSGVMAKGDSSTFNDPSHAGETLTVSVDANGVVALSGTFTGYAADFSNFYYLTVAPAGTNGGARVSNVALYGTAGPALVINSYADGADVDALTNGAPYCTPNPSVFPGLPSDFGCKLRIGG